MIARCRGARAGFARRYPCLTSGAAARPRGRSFIIDGVGLAG